MSLPSPYLPMTYAVAVDSFGERDVSRCKYGRRRFTYNSATFCQCDVPVVDDWRSAQRVDREKFFWCELIRLPLILPDFVRNF